MSARLTQAEAAALTIAVAIECGANLTDPVTRYTKRVQTVRHNNGTEARRRPSGGRMARFASAHPAEPVDRASASLAADHPAVIEGRTLFPGRVFDAGKLQRVLISGNSNAKIGAFIVKGPWAGFPVYLLTLEERATCPRSCEVWRQCYGNGMHAAVRYRYDDALIYHIEDELAALNRKHPRGFAVRLHVLGDFPDAGYVQHWRAWSDRFKALHVWGYTAHAPETVIGQSIQRLNRDRPTRWQVRFSVAAEGPIAPMQAAVVWTMPEHTSLHDGALVCPQELGKAQTCGACGICWKPELSHVRVNFLGHGGRRGAAA